MAFWIDGVAPSRVIFNGTALTEIVNENGEVIWNNLNIKESIKEFTYTDNFNGTCTITGLKSGTAAKQCIIPDDYRIIF